MTDPRQADNPFRIIFNAVPLPLFRLSREVEVLDLNSVAHDVFNATPDQDLKKRGGEVMRCINAIDSPAGCGTGEFCPDCRIRNSVNEVFDTVGEIKRQRWRAEVRNDGKVIGLDLLFTPPIRYKDEMSALLCLEDITEITSLREIIPIFTRCKKIRNDQELWNSLEHCFDRFMGSDSTHSLYPDCARLLYQDLPLAGKDEG